MKQLKQTKPQCLLFAFAMVLEEEPQTLINEIGHDGLDVWWPEASGAFRHRGFHIQELVDCSVKRHYAAICIDSYPGLCNPSGDGGEAIYSRDQAEMRMQTYLNKFDGVIVTESHAVAWDHTEGACYDPNGYKSVVGDYQIREFWAIAHV